MHGPGGTSSATKVRPVAAYAGKSAATATKSYSGPTFGGPANFGEGKYSSNAYSSSEIGQFGGPAFAKGFGSQGNYEFQASNADYNRGYEGGASDEVGSYSSGGPSYATFTGSKASFTPPQFSHGGSRGNAYSTANVNVGGTVSGHGNFHPPAFTGSFKPSGTKTYTNKYNSPKAGFQAGGSSSSSFGTGPFAGSETGYNSRALKAGYSADNEEYSREDANLFGGFGDGAGFKVQSSYSSNVYLFIIIFRVVINNLTRILRNSKSFRKTEQNALGEMWKNFIKIRG